MSASFTAVRSFHNKKPLEENTARRPSGNFPVKRGLVPLVLMGAAFLAQLAGALFPAPLLFLAGSAGGLLLELYILRRRPYLVAALGRLRFDVTARQLLRDALIVVGLVRLPGIDPLEEQPLALALLAGYFLHFCCQAAALLIRRRRTLPFVTRNIDASALRLSSAPPRLLARQPSRRLLYFALPATAGLMASALTAEALWGLLGVGVTLALHLGGVLRLAAWLRPGAQPVNEQQALEWLDRRLAEYRPTVAMYFSGGAASAYQANMWLGTLSELEARPLIVLRERFMVQKIDATDVPIVCIPKVAHLMRLEHSSLKIMLHPANSGKTSQVLRIPSIKHAFINHGESDKLSSCNPYAKAYDEVWVAGRAARDRYRLADIGVDDRDVVEVGRPQLAPIRPCAGPPAADGPVTVLYAPTWEGWTDDPGNTSVILAGENIVRALLADPKVRLLYKPHPMTGSVDPRAARADERIQQMIAEANDRRSGPRPGPEAAAELARRTAALDELTSTAFRPSADEMERMLLQSTPEGDREAAVAAATAAWEEAYWASFPDWEHLVVTGPRPALYACFNRSDLLISDVSSVVSDWLASEKPYAVANTSGLTEEEFRAGLPTVRAATILTPDAAGVPALLDSVRDPSRDTMARARAELKTHLLGPADPPSIVRFDRAVAALCAKADRRRELMALRTDDSSAPRVAAEATEAAEAAEAEAAEAGQESDPSDSENSLTT